MNSAYGGSIYFDFACLYDQLTNSNSPHTFKNDKYICVIMINKRTIYTRLIIVHTSRMMEDFYINQNFIQLICACWLFSIEGGNSYQFCFRRSCNHQNKVQTYQITQKLISLEQ